MFDRSEDRLKRSRGDPCIVLDESSRALVFRLIDSPTQGASLQLVGFAAGDKEVVDMSHHFEERIDLNQGFSLLVEATKLMPLFAGKGRKFRLGQLQVLFEGDLFAEHLLKFWNRGFFQEEEGMGLHQFCQSGQHLQAVDRKDKDDHKTTSTCFLFPGKRMGRRRLSGKVKVFCFFMLASLV